MGFQPARVSLQSAKMGGPSNQKGHSPDYMAVGEPGNLAQTLIEAAGDIGRLSFFRSNPEKDVDKITRKIDEYIEMLLERSQQARQLSGYRIDVYQG